MRIAFENVGGSCVFSSEIDPVAADVYEANFGERPSGCIRQIALELRTCATAVPDHDVLVAGFPCQPFSIAGVSKRRSLARPDGFEDEVHGTLFFQIEEILREKRPKAFFLENVKHLRRHNNGKTLETMMKILEELNYSVVADVVNANEFVPQARERLFILGLSKSIPGAADLAFPKVVGTRPKLAAILSADVPERFTLSANLWQCLQDYAARHKAKGNGFGFGEVTPEGVARTLSARYYKDGAEILLRQEGKSPRRLTDEECLKLMGFPEWYDIWRTSERQAYRLLGNSVVVPAVEYVAKHLVQRLGSAAADKQLPKVATEAAG